MNNRSALTKKIIGSMLAAVSLLFMSFVLIPRQEAFAATAANQDIFKKILAQGIYKCYTNGAVQSSFASINNNYNVIQGIVSTNAHNVQVPLITGMGSGSIFELSNYNVPGSTIDCARFINGDNDAVGGSNSSIYSVRGVDVPTAGDTTGTKNFLENMGYTVLNWNQGNDCLSIVYGFKHGGRTEGRYQTGSICVDENGRLSSILRVASGNNSGPASPLEFSIDNNDTLCFLTGSNKEKVGCTTLNSKNEFGPDWVRSVFSSAGTVKPNGGSIAQIVEVSDSDTSDGTATMPNSRTAAITAVNFLLGTNYQSDSDFRLDEAETRILYQDYLESYYGYGHHCPATSEERKIAWYHDGTVDQDCSYYATGNAREGDTRQVNSVTSGGLVQIDGTNLGDIVTYLGAHTAYTEEQVQEMGTIQAAGNINQQVRETAIENDDDTDLSELNKQCKQDAGLDGIAWIVCPVVSNSTKAATGLEKTINKMLSTDADLYSSSSDAYEVWGTMRDIANAIVALVLIVVIFSQLTGFGIDNYGVKRILPRLIVMAILINLSFVICQILIDLSNIFGSGLSTLLRNGVGDSSAKTVAKIVSTLLAGIGVGGMIATGYGAVVAGPMVILSLVLSLLGALVAVLMFFVTLSARSIIVIVFTALSPIAFACYVLPNTQSIFKRWWKIFSAALLVYPICGGLYGLSFVIKKIFGSSEGLLGPILALLSPFLPFFVMPSLLKSAMSGLGAAGNAVMAIGNGIRKGLGSVNDSVKSTDSYKAGIESATLARKSLASERRIANRSKSFGARLLSGVNPKNLRRTYTRARDLRSSTEATQYGKYQEALARSNLINEDPNYFANTAKRREVAMSNELEKSYMEQYSTTDKGDLKERFEGMLETIAKGDAGSVKAEELSAVQQRLVEFGGTREALDAIREHGIGNMSESQRNLVTRNMASSNIDALKAFAKYRQKGGRRDFNAWLSGEGITKLADGNVQETYTDADGSQKSVAMAEQYMSYGGHWNYRGAEHLSSLAKDEMEFIDAHAEDFIGNGVGKVSNKMAAESLLRSAVYSKDVGNQNRAEKMLRSGLASGQYDIDDLGINAQMLGNMKRVQTIQAIRDGLAQNFSREDVAAGGVGLDMTDDQNAIAARNRYLQSRMENTIREARKYNKIWTGMNNDVRDIIDVSSDNVDNNTGNTGGSQSGPGSANQGTDYGAGGGSASGSTSGSSSGSAGTSGSTGTRASNDNSGANGGTFNVRRGAPSAPRPTFGPDGTITQTASGTGQRSNTRRTIGWARTTRAYDGTGGNRMDVYEADNGQLVDSNGKEVVQGRDYTPSSWSWNRDDPAQGQNPPQNS